MKESKKEREKMKREVDINEISDGKLYSLNDMVKVGCNDCQGCFACCQGMGTSVILDPLDIYRLSKHLHFTFTQLLEKSQIELNVVDGIILPNLKMAEPLERCSFLNKDGRCSVHEARPGICRLFPLGRYYEKEGFQYFLQVHECPKENKTKVKVKNWIDTPDVKKYETYILAWHNLLKKLEKLVETKEEVQVKQICLLLLQEFFVLPYDYEMDFYSQFWKKLEKFEKDCCL